MKGKNLPLRFKSSNLKGKMRSVGSLILFMTFLLAGCVGTVQDATQAYNKINEAPKSSLAFAGITNAVAISDSRIEVFFYPATGGSGKYNYDVMIGNEPFPISFPSEVLVPDFRGLLKVTITGLSRLTTYQIKVEVRDKDSEVQSNSGIIKNITTFDNLVADYAGITAAFNTPGQDGKDSIKVRWNNARISGAISKKEWDPKSYEIVLVDAERLTPLDMDLPYTVGEGRWVFTINHDDNINEYIVRGLPSKKRFYVRMRALHQNSVEDVYDPKKRGEMNTNYVIISTLSADLADINFQGESFAVALAPGEQGLNSVIANWGKATGVFDHFRLYYSEAGGGVAAGSLPDLCLSPLVSDLGETVFCKRATFDADSAPITGLKPYTEYEVVLVLCATTQCPSDQRIVAPFRTIVTDPSFPAFNGVKDVIIAQDLVDIGTITIKFDRPDFTLGFFDGLILKMRRTTDGSDPEEDITETTIQVYHANYNFLTDNEILLYGIDYLAIQPYCFTLYPFKWADDGVTKRESPNDVWRCVQPRPEAATADQFKGFVIEGSNTTEDVLTISWIPPEAGIFSHYEIFWSKPGISFNWGIAISQAGTDFNYTNYGRKLLPSGTTTWIMDGFADGVYTFGVVTYYTYVTDSGNVVLRSETNEGLATCTFNSADPNPIDCQ